MFQTTFEGAAVAVATTVPAAAVAVIACHDPGWIHSHDATFTNCVAPAGGAISIVGEASASLDSANFAKA
jgi:hypothetical protein